MPGLDATDAANLRNILGQQFSAGADRAKFYLAYGNLISSASGGGAEQALIQAQITTYSGFWGGAAIIGNRNAQVKG